MANFKKLVSWRAEKLVSRQLISWRVINSFRGNSFRGSKKNSFRGAEKNSFRGNSFRGGKKKLVLWTSRSSRGLNPLTKLVDEEYGFRVVQEVFRHLFWS